VRTQFGAFSEYDCVKPNALPITAPIFFYTFTMLTAYVVLSLFISVVTRTMFEVMDCKSFDDQRRRELQASRHIAPPSSRRSALLSFIFFFLVAPARRATPWRSHSRRPASVDSLCVSCPRAPPLAQRLKHNHRHIAAALANSSSSLREAIAVVFDEVLRSIHH
jgi:hypothetical protein